MGAKLRPRANLRRREAEHLRERLREAGERPAEAERHALAIAAATPDDQLGRRSPSLRRGGRQGGRAPKRRSALGRKRRHALQAAHRPSRSVHGRTRPLAVARSATR